MSIFISRATTVCSSACNSSLKAIVGIEIAIERLESKAKLSQNREARDRLGAAGTLVERGTTELGGLMQRAG